MKLYGIFLLSSAWCVCVSAALPPLAGEELDARADLIMTGRVVESRVLVNRRVAGSTYVVRLGVEVMEVEKGEMRGALEIRTWTMRTSRMVGATGQNVIPAEGAAFRAWLTKGEGNEWLPLEPNGFELLDGSTAMTFAVVERKRIGWSFAVSGVLGAVVVGWILWLRVGRRQRDRSWGVAE